MALRTLPSIILAATGATIAGSRIYNRIQRNWRSTREERLRHLPGDDLVPHAMSDSTMAITIDAPPEAVWPWLVQMGVDRAGFYTHTWLENGLLRLRVTNAEQIVPRWQGLRPGDHVWFTQANAKGKRIGPTVVRIEPNRALILGHGDDPENWAGTWQFVLEPIGTDAGAGTRLLLRSRSAPDQPLAMAIVNRVCEPGYYYMDIGMLKGIKQRAERCPTTGRANPDARGPAPRILIAVASMQGSTREIGQAMAGELGMLGIGAEVRDVNEVTTLDGWDGVILGSAIHNHHWLRGALLFAQRFRPELASLPTWLFSVGMQAADQGAWPDPYPADLPRLLDDTSPHAHQLFLGRRQAIRPAWLMRALSTAFRLSIGDRRDWPAIRAWAHAVGEDLGQRRQAGDQVAA